MTMRACAFVMLVGVLAAACRSVPRQQVDSVPPSEAAPNASAHHPATVRALRYRTWISLDPSRSFAEGYWEEQLWFPEWKLEAGTYADPMHGRMKLSVRPSDWPHANTNAGTAFIPVGGDPRTHYKGLTEAIEVPWALAQRIRAAGELQARFEVERERVGTDLAASGLLRELPEGDTRQ